MSLFDSLITFLQGMGVFSLSWQMVGMWGIAILLLYLGVAKQYEPLLMVPIAFGALIANIPDNGMLITQLNQQGGGVLGYAREGTIYPILYRLQEQGLVKTRLAPAAANGGSKKYYSLTDKGRETLEELAAFWGEYAACVDGFLQRWKEESP